jgi:Polyketide cyclase / dehydrase and lipid transport
MGQTYQSITIQASPERVWTTLRGFHDMSWAPNVITGLEIIGDAASDEPGAGRVLNGAFHETLRQLNDEERTFSYSIDDGPSPVSKDDVKNYIGRVSVQEGDQEGSTTVEWSSSWEQNDESAYEFCHGIYVALLAELKSSLE